MSVPVEHGGRADDGPVDVAGVVEDGAAAGATADEGDFLGRRWGQALGEERVVDFEPGVLVAAEDDAGGVGVEEEDGGGRGGGLEEGVLEGEVEEGVGGGGAVDLEGGGEGGGGEGSGREWWS